MISQRLSLDMSRLSQNQRIEALTMLARGDNVSNVSRAFGCHRNTIIRLRQCFQQTFDVVFKRRQVLQGSTVSANRQCCAASGKPGNPFGQGGPMWDKCLQHVIELPVCSGHNGISVEGDSSGLGFYALMSPGLTLVIMTVEFEFLEEEGNVLLIIVSLRGTDLKVGVLWYWFALCAEGKQISLLCKTTSMLKVTLTRFCRLKMSLSFKGIGLQYRCMMLQGYVDSFLNRNNVNVIPWPAVSPDMNPIEHIWDYLGRKGRARGNVHNLRDLENTVIQEWNNIPNVVIRRYVGQCEVALLLASIVEVATLDTDYSKH